jgi:hypothetical protein
MPRSYENTPSKAVARLIFVDLLRHLTPIRAPKDCQYVGFGALEFVDFDLIHRQVGIADMISIEKSELIERYEWNRPFNSITVIGGRASTILPGIDWSRPSVVWLDYTDPLNTEVIGDVETVARRLIPGSILTVTVNAHPLRLGEGEGRRAELEKNITRERVPLGVTDDRLGDWGLAEVQYEVLMAVINESFASRGDGTSFKQLLHIHYKDSARMQIIGGIVSAPNLEGILDQCRFDDMPETRSGKDALYIRVPLLTPRERAWADQQLPIAPGASPLAMPGIDPKDLLDYSDVYRRLAATG